MTYYEIVKLIQSACEGHKQVQSYGYGMLSNIQAPQVLEGRNYPYVFLNPTQHTLTEHQIEYNFNLIIMGLALADDYRDVTNSSTIEIQQEDTVLLAQSYCLQIGLDILAHFRYSVLTTDVVVQTSAVPFEERFDDTVSGMTLGLRIILPNPLSACEPIII